MADIKQWIRQIECVSPPDQWTDISAEAPSFGQGPGGHASHRRPQGHREDPSAWKKVAVIAAALALTVAATGMLVQVFRSDRHVGPSQPFPSPMANGDIWASVGTGEGGLTIERVDPITGASSSLWSDGRDSSIPESKIDRPAVGSDYSFSPDGSQVVFSASDPTSALAIELFLMNADGTDIRQLTHDGGLDEFPAWSPDGRSIAYVDNRGARMGCLGAACLAHLYVLDLANGARRQLIDGPVGQWAPPSWSPDGTKIVFVSQASDGSGQLEVMNADGSNRTQITTGSGSFVSWPAWSPDGRQILFLQQSRSRGETAHLWTVGPDGSNPRDLLDTGADTNFGRPVWSPDATKIAYARVVGGVPQLWVVQADGSADRRLAQRADKGGVVPIAWQPVPPTASGSPTIRVPNVVGLPLERAVDRLRRLGLDSSVASGLVLTVPDRGVLGQTPTAGTAVSTGTTVRLYVS